MGRTALLSAVCLGLLLAAPVARAAFMVPGAPWRPKDFAFFKKDGVYHLFYIRNNTQLPLTQTEVDFGHAVSPDLFFWTQRPVALETDPNNWDNEHVWAPHIVEAEGLYWMFYTGVTLAPGFSHTQQTGLAYSTDLETWHKLRNPIFSAAQVPWAWWNPLNAQAGFRDPFVMPDTAHAGQWLMYYTAYPASDTTGSLVGIARSNGGMDQWLDLKPLWIAHQSQTFNPLTESPHLFAHNGLWYMVVTTSSGQPLTLFTSPDPTADPAAWTYRGRLSTMLGYDTSFWYASEYLRDGLRDYFAFVSGDRIDIREIRWSTTDWKFQLIQPPLLHVRSLGWAADTVMADSSVSLSVDAVNVFGGLQSIEFVADDPVLGPVPVPAESLGFVNPLPLTGETTLVSWNARRWPRTLPESAVARLKVRTIDQTAESDWLVVTPQPTVPPPPLDPGDLPIVRRSSLIRATRLPGFVAAGQGFAVELEAPAAGRVDLYDVGGRRVRTLADQHFGAGLTLLLWDQRDSGGGRVKPGVYFARLTAGTATGTARVVVTAH